MLTLANSVDPDEMLHNAFVEVLTRILPHKK